MQVKKRFFYYLTDGIVPPGKMLTITKISVGAFDTNCYIVCSKALDALIIDPGTDPGKISKIAGHCRLKVRAYLITHGHMDHIGALAPLREQIQAPVAMHGADLKWAFSPANQMPPHFSVPRRPDNIERILKGGEKWREEDFNYEVIATPGHSPGGVSYYFPDDNTLFSGDTLFQDSIGRTDLPGGNMKQLNKSLKILAGLPPETEVYPGHGPKTTIAREIEYNPFLKCL